MHIKILIINDEGEDIQLEKEIIKKSLSGKPYELTVKYIPATDYKSIKSELPEADGVISVNTIFDKATLESMKRCKIIATQTIGINCIDFDAASNEGICITNVPDYCIEEVATHTVALALSCARRIKTYDNISRKKIWNLADIYNYGLLYRIQDKTYGLVSFGKTAKRVSEMIKGLGMKVMAFDPFLSDSVFEEYGVIKVDSLEELFSACDIISLHSPLTKETEGIIDIGLLKRMPKGAILINTSRGGIVKEQDLYLALKEGILDSAGIDVIADELEYNSSLYELDNIILTPHIAYYSEEALRECRVKAAEQVGDVIGRGQIPKYLVNKDVKGKTKIMLS